MLETARVHGLYPIVRDFARDIAQEANILTPSETNCIDRALAVQQVFANNIGAVPELQAAEVSCGIVINVDGLKFEEGAKRFIHASNFILASLGNRHAIMELDGYFDQTRKVTATTDPVRLATRDSFGHYSAVYGERRDKSTSWKAGIAKNVRKTPFVLNPHRDHKIVLGSNAGNIALLELRKALSGENFDKSRLPILLLSARG